ncbi:basic salivary proline-rich protein 4-like [Eubalaena glacialis]|uniref:basic salivary proline-rich protein 4-like n=1 Tax=Eubalaena glacialis TaxID=27606 RepID=UPI002A59F404|nr:basic salivary proline-rich protein 4-like [Eubalaena glacialis]
MARPRPWPAHPGRLGPAPQRRPGLPPPSSQPAGPPGRAVRLRGLAPPPCGRGPERSSLIGPEARARFPGAGFSRSPPSSGDSDGGSGGSAAGAGRVRARLAVAAPTQGGEGSGLASGSSVWGPRGSRGSLPRRSTHSPAHPSPRGLQRQLVQSSHSDTAAPAVDALSPLPSLLTSATTEALPLLPPPHLWLFASSGSSAEDQCGKPVDFPLGGTWTVTDHKCHELCCAGAAQGQCPPPEGGGGEAGLPGSLASRPGCLASPPRSLRPPPSVGRRAELGSGREHPAPPRRRVRLRLPGRLFSPEVLGLRPQQGSDRQLTEEVHAPPTLADPPAPARAPRGADGSGGSA